jgi:RNA polymerase sigma-70 factor, ECF subfamily
VPPARRTELAPNEAAPDRTLGDLLGADESTARVPEDDWVGLVRAIAAGDQRALHALYERTHRLVYTLTMRLTNDSAAAEELTVDIFHDVWRRACAYDPADGSVVGWIMNQARSRALDRVRFDHRKKRVPREIDASRDPSPEIDPRQVLDAKEQERLVRDALGVLTLAERQAIETTFFGELTYREAADQLDQPVGTVKTRIRSGLTKLRRALAEGAKRR